MGYRDRLPQLDADRPFLADGGLETTLIFHRGIALPLCAAFDLLRQHHVDAVAREDEAGDAAGRRGGQRRARGRAPCPAPG